MCSACKYTTLSDSEYLTSLQGIIVDCDQELSSLSGYHVPSDLVGVNITKLIPALQLPSGTNMNKVCGR